MCFYNRNQEISSYPLGLIDFTSKCLGQIASRTECYRNLWRKVQNPTEHDPSFASKASHAIYRSNSAQNRAELIPKN